MKPSRTQVAPDRVQVHYQDWAEKWDAWHEKGNDDLMPLGSHTSGKTKRKGSKGALFKAVRSCDVREAFQLSSKITGKLKAGEMVTVVEQMPNNTGQMRVRIENPCVGWTSIVTRDGETLLVPCGEGQESSLVAKEDPNKGKEGGNLLKVDWEKQGVPGVSSRCKWYVARDGESMRSLAAKFGHSIRADDILHLNKRLYPNLTINAKLKGGTKIRIPDPPDEAEMHAQVAAAAAAKLAVEPQEAKWYKALNDETPKMIANKLGVEVVDLVACNRSRYEGLTQTARLQAVTKLRLPRSRASGSSDSPASNHKVGAAGNSVGAPSWLTQSAPEQVIYRDQASPVSLDTGKINRPPVLSGP